MDALIYFVEFNLAYIVRLLVAFVFLMTLYHRIDKSSVLWRVIKYPLKAAGLVFVLFDWVYNYVMSIYLLDPPAHWKELVTGRLSRYLKEEPPDSFRYKFARFFCERFLNRADPGHCD